MTDVPSPEEQIDFDAAEMYVRMAREAHASGDKSTCAAACKMVAVALCLTEQPSPRFHLGHLAAS